MMDFKVRTDLALDTAKKITPLLKEGENDVKLVV